MPCKLPAEATKLREAQSVCSAPVSVDDVLPTLLSIAALPMVPDLDGQNISGYLMEDESFQRSSPLLFHYPHTWAQGGYVPAAGYAPHSALRDGDWKVIYYYETGRWELHNLAEDISEAFNLAGAQPVTLARTARKLVQRLESLNAVYPVRISNNQVTRPSMPYDPNLDSDGDGVSDLDEDPNKNGIVDPGETDPDASDTDQDGMGDGDEEHAGTDPLDPASSFRLSLQAQAYSGPFSLSWPGRTSASYRLESTTNLASRQWSVFADDISGQAGVLDFALPASTSEKDGERFFRVLLK